ncbi:MAG: bifunctional metallophosphatase/5'-nucleotidase [Oscillospiraceae bacterium]
MKKILALLLALMLVLAGCAPAETGDNSSESEQSQQEEQNSETVENEETEEPVEPKGVVVLYANDVHCGVDDKIGYAGVAAYKKAYEKAGYEVLLVDCGDAVQGATIGTLSQGGYIVEIMNELGYVASAVGNHEFDYGMDRFFELNDLADYDYVSANFIDKDGNRVLDAYTVVEAAGHKIAFVGVSTPETFTSSSPAYFQDENGNFIYGFCEGNDGADFYAAVQTAVDDARNDGADLVVVLSHLGTNAESAPYTSSDLIVNTNGIDVVLDGHSHSVWEGEHVKNKDGEEVILSSTGTKLANLGSLTIVDGEEGVELETKLHDEALFQDEEMEAFVAGIKAQYAELAQTVVARSDVDLTIVDPTATDADGKPIRIIRSQETNLGDLCADAYRAMSGADIAFVNGGGIRTSIPAGAITYEQIISVHPFGNALCVVEATGQEILDALEMGVRNLPSENGGFLQVSGISFEIDMSVESTVETNDKGLFVKVSGARRVKNVMVGDAPIDPAATYTLASHNYMLKESGDGINMFADNVLLQDSVLIDNQVLIKYITEHLNGVVGEEYSEPYGQGRITIVNG